MSITPRSRFSACRAAVGTHAARRSGLTAAGLLGLVVVAISTAGFVTGDTAAAASCRGGQWQAEYFSNTTLTGAPLAVQCESDVNYSYGLGGPAVTGLGTDNFSVRWTMTSFYAGGSYQLSTNSDDGVRVTLDRGTSAARTVISNWSDHGATADSATVTLPAGVHSIVVEYYERTGSATIRYSSAGVPVRVNGYWWSDQSAVPLGSAGCSTSSGTATANALRKEWDYWDNCGGSEVTTASEGLPPVPGGSDRVFKWYKPLGDDNVYQKLNRTLTRDNWPMGGETANSQSPADVSGRYIVYQYMPSEKLRLSPGHGWVIPSEFKENYRDMAGTWHQSPTWGVGCNDFSGDITCSLTPSGGTHFLLSSYTCLLYTSD